MQTVTTIAKLRAEAYIKKDFAHKTSKVTIESPGAQKMLTPTSCTINLRKTHRNDPCPCGSGLKHKKCCLQSKH